MRVNRVSLSRVTQTSPLKKKRFRIPSSQFNREEHRRLFDKLADSLRIKHFDDWYNLKVIDLQVNGLRSILQHYGDSMVRALTHVYPEFDWHAWRFSWVPHGYWDSHQNKRQAFDWIAEQLKIETQEDWYSYRASDVSEWVGSSLIQSHDSSLYVLLSSIYPEFLWKGWKFDRIGKTFWNNKDNQRLYFDSLAEELNIRDKDDWYNFKASTCMSEKINLGFLKQYYDGSLVAALKSVYPEHEFLPWKFVQVDQGFWDREENNKEYLKWLTSKLDIKSVDDWKNVSSNQIIMLNGYSFLAKHGGLKNFLDKQFPDREWGNEDLPPQTKEQWFLLNTLHSILGEHYRIVNIRM